MREHDLKHGALPINKVTRAIKKAIRRFKNAGIAKGMGFDWNVGYDVRNHIGAIKIKNQGDNLSCGGQSGSYFIDIQRRLMGINDGELSAKSVYAPIAHQGGGTTVTDLMIQIAMRGANTELLIPSYDVSDNPLPEIKMIDKSWENDATIKDAENRAGFTPYDIAEDIDEVANTIYTYGAVLVEITGQNNGTWASAYPTHPLKSNPNPLWNHFQCLIGAKMINGKKYAIALQSMGTNWGEQGIQYFGEDYFKSGYIIDCFTLIPDYKLKPIPGNNDFWTNLWKWFMIWKKQLAMA